VTFIRYDDATGDQHVAMWPPARVLVRRGTSATSVGGSSPSVTSSSPAGLQIRLNSNTHSIRGMTDIRI
jgi:hypothetical protein